MYAPPEKLPLPKVINLLTDRKEERDVAAYNSWPIRLSESLVSWRRASISTLRSRRVPRIPTRRRLQLLDSDVVVPGSEPYVS
jgi:hypothetical protein